MLKYHVTVAGLVCFLVVLTAAEVLDIENFGISLEGEQRERTVEGHVRG